MSDQKWNELSERLEALALKLHLHLEQRRSEQPTEADPDALESLRRGVEQAFDAAGRAVRDDAVRADFREVGRLVADALSVTMERVGNEVKDSVRRR